MPLLRHADCLLVFPTYLQLQSLLGPTALHNLAPMPIEERRDLRLSRPPTLVSCHPHCVLFSVTIENNLDGLSQIKFHHTGRHILSVVSHAAR